MDQLRRGAARRAEKSELESALCPVLRIVFALVIVVLVVEVGVVSDAVVVALPLSSPALSAVARSGQQEPCPR